jgi:hypothetical protein
VSVFVLNFATDINRMDFHIKFALIPNGMLKMHAQEIKVE